jgi:hypothetical protein
MTYEHHREHLPNSSTFQYMPTSPNEHRTCPNKCTHQNWQRKVSERTTDGEKCPLTKPVKNLYMTLCCTMLPIVEVTHSAIPFGGLNSNDLNSRGEKDQNIRTYLNRVNHYCCEIPRNAIEANVCLPPEIRNSHHLPSSHFSIQCDIQSHEEG